jgi:hypothetical protein
MKKLLFILAIVAVYSLSITNTKAGVIASEKSKVTIVASNSNPGITQDDTKKTDVKKETECVGKKVESKSEGKSEGTGCSAKDKAVCGEAKGCCSHKEPTTAPEKK